MIVVRTVVDCGGHADGKPVCHGSSDGLRRDVGQVASNSIGFAVRKGNGAM